MQGGGVGHEGRLMLEAILSHIFNDASGARDFFVGDEIMDQTIRIDAVYMGSIEEIHAKIGKLNKSYISILGYEPFDLCTDYLIMIQGYLEIINIDNGFPCRIDILRIDRGKNEQLGKDRFAFTIEIDEESYNYQYQFLAALFTEFGLNNRLPEVTIRENRPEITDAEQNVLTELGKNKTNIQIENIAEASFDYIYLHDKIFEAVISQIGLTLSQADITPKKCGFWGKGFTIDFYNVGNNKTNIEAQITSELGQEVWRIAESTGGFLPEEKDISDYSISESLEDKEEFHKPWEHMEGAEGYEIHIVSLWCTTTKTQSEIGGAAGMKMKLNSIANLLGELRIRYPKANIPLGAVKRKNYRIKYLKNENLDNN